MSEKGSTLHAMVEDLIKNINKQYPSAYVVSGKDHKDPYVNRRSWGVMSLDIASGGGIPYSTIGQVSGAPSTGKNALINRIAAANQLIYGKDSALCFVGLERFWDKVFARLCGVQIALKDEEQERMRNEMGSIVPKEANKTVGEITIVEPGSSFDTSLTAVLNIVASGLYQFVFIDSLSVLFSDESDGKDFYGWKVAESASYQSQFIKKLLRTIYSRDTDGRPKTQTIALFTNQVRADMDPGPRKYKSVMPWIMNHEQAVELYLRKASTISKDGIRSIGWKVAKGKHGIREDESGELDIVYNGGFDVYADVVITLAKQKLVKRTGSQFFIDHEQSPISKQAPGSKEQIIMALQQDAALKKTVYNLIAAACNLPQHVADCWIKIF